MSVSDCSCDTTVLEILNSSYVVLNLICVTVMIMSPNGRDFRSCSFSFFEKQIGKKLYTFFKKKNCVVKHCACNKYTALFVI
jgi:hypothetical protein